MEAEFETLDPQQPATVTNVAAAVLHLSRFDEAHIAELIACGELHRLFPYQPESAAVDTLLTTVADSMDEAELTEASAIPLDDKVYFELVRASMPQPPVIEQDPAGRGFAKRR